MKRSWMGVLLAVALCVPVAAGAVDMAKATDALFTAIQAGVPAGKTQTGTEFTEAESWMSAVVTCEDADYTEWYGFVYSGDADGLVGWDGLFADEEAAAARIETIAEASVYANAYAEHNQIVPVPRDNFALVDGQLVVYYPPEQLSHFSGRAGAFAFYAYELDGVLRDDVPLTRGDVAQADQGLAETLAAGRLPGALEAWTLGTAMQAADDALGLVDVPDVKDGEAVWHFEAPEMRGVAFLSPDGVNRVDSAVIGGVHAERIDFYGLQTGVATETACVAVLGEPDARETVTDGGAYALLPAGEQLTWQGTNAALSMHFIDGTLHSVTLRNAN